MKLVKIVNSEELSNKHSEIYLLDSGRYEVFNMVGKQISRGFPNKTYFTEPAAIKYANKFLGDK